MTKPNLIDLLIEISVGIFIYNLLVCMLSMDS
jgi:hypothetical protein